MTVDTANVGFFQRSKGTTGCGLRRSIRKKITAMAPKVDGSVALTPDQHADHHSCQAQGTIHRCNATSTGPAQGPSPGGIKWSIGNEIGDTSGALLNNYTGPVTTA